MNYDEYKKLRGKGYRANTAKAIMDQRDGFTYDLGMLPDEPLIIKKNGFKFVVTMHEDGDAWVLLEDFGEFSDEWDLNAIPHEHNNPRTYKWFIPANTDSPESLSRTGMSRHEAMIVSMRQGRQNYKKVLSYGETWAYYDIHVCAYLDQPEMEDYCLIDDWCGGINVNYGESPDPCWSSTIDQLIHNLLPLAMEKLLNIKMMMDKLEIGPHPTSDHIDRLVDELKEYGAVFLIMESNITEQTITEWADDGISSMLDDEDSAPNGKSLKSWLKEVKDHATDIAIRLNS